jgi:hypothetical protein
MRPPGHGGLLQKQRADAESGEERGEGRACRSGADDDDREVRRRRFFVSFFRG